MGTTDKKDSAEIDYQRKERRRRFLKRTGASAILFSGLAGCSARRKQGQGGQGGQGGQEEQNSNSNKTKVEGNGSSNSDSSLPGIIKMGGTMPLSGSNAKSGELYMRGYKMAVDDINNGSDDSPYSWKGGGIPLNEHNKRLKVKTLIKDSQTKPDRGVNLYKQLITQQNIPVAIGPYTSTMTLAVGNVMEQNKVPWMAPSATSPTVYNQGWKYIFGNKTLATALPQPQINWLANSKPTPEKVGLFYEAGEGTQTTAEQTLKYAKNNTDLNITMVGSYPKSPNDISSILQRAASNGVDCFLNSGLISSDTLFVRQLHSTGIINQAKAIGVGVSIGVPDFSDNLGKNAIGVHGPQSWQPVLANGLSYSGVGAFVKRYKKQYGESPDYHVANAFDAVNLLGKAIQKAGTLDNESIRKQLSTATFKHTLGGTFEFRDNGTLKSPPALAVQAQESSSNISIEAIAPENLRTAKPIYPIKS